MRSLFFLVSVCGGLTVAAAPSATSAEDWRRLVGVLQYLEADYPAAVASQDAFELAEQKAFIAEALSTARGLGAPAEPFIARLTALQERINNSSDAPGVSRDSAALAQEITASAGLERAPRRPPNLTMGRALWNNNCVVCHGANGDGKTPFAETLKPPPANLVDPEVSAGLSPFRVFNVLTSGIPGTAMPGFPTLSDQDRWNLSFFVLALERRHCLIALPEVSLETLATETNEQLAQRFGPQVATCLRVAPPAPTAVTMRTTLAAAVDRIEKARQLAHQGATDAARAALVDIYLQEFEPLEPLLRSRAPKTVMAIEHDFMAARQAVARPQELDAALASLSANLSKLQGPQTAPADFWSVFFGALLILLREGFEAAVVVGALLAVLKKVGAASQVRTVHAGWVAALVAGIGGFLLGHRALSGANREALETFVGFIAVGMLLYAALWLNARAHVSQYMGELREKMKGALGTGSAWGLFMISFTAVARETFETALFLQGLATDSMSGAVYGGLSGLAILVVLLAVIRRVGFVLPMKTLFNASTVLLVLTATMILGKAMHGLLELGYLEPAPVQFFTVSALGIFADAWTLVPQAVLLAIPTAVWVWRRRQQRGSKWPRPAATQT